jgi:2-aminophenol/2-amino-5-chlorophenol 1,6-dioxygenase beta subunit
MKGKIVAGCLAPHPPHLIYAEGPPQNEAKGECGWESLRWAYEKQRESLNKLDFDVMVVLSPHWRTYVGTHILNVPRIKSISVDPIFPHLFRYHYDLQVDTELAQCIYSEGVKRGQTMKLMNNPHFRVDYGTIVSCHLLNPKWDKPIVVLSSHAASSYFSADVMQEEMLELAQSTKAAIESSGRKALLVASNSLSHRHFTNEPPLPEDMSFERIYNHNQYLWDLRLMELMKQGKTKEIFELMPDFIEQAVSEADSGAFTWMLASLDFPTTPAQVYGYGTVIGTGNAGAEFRPDRSAL